MANEPTKTAVINVSFVNQPNPGKTYGSIKTKENTFFSVHPSMLGLLKPGTTYEVVYTSSLFNNKEYHKLVSFKECAVSDPPRTNTGTGIGPAAINHNDATAERIFVCGGLNAGITSGRVDIHNAQDIISAVTAMKVAWTSAMIGNPQRREDLNDEVPF